MSAVFFFTISFIIHTNFALAVEPLYSVGNFVEITDEKLKVCHTYKYINVDRKVPWKLKLNLYLIDIPTLTGTEPGALATDKIYEKSGTFIKSVSLKAIGGVPFKDEKGFTKFVKVFVDCKP